MEIPSATATQLLSWAQSILGVPVTTRRERHGDEGETYELQTESGNYFLKLKKDSDFSKERGRLEWLRERLPVPIVVDSTQETGVGALLLTALPGKNLAVLAKEWKPELVISRLADAIRAFHAYDTRECPFGEPVSDAVLVHGDACLPNFIFENERLSGYIDVADCRIDTPEVDLAAAVWSLEYNLGHGYGARFLQEYGYADTSEDTVADLYARYVGYQQAHGFLEDE